MHMRTIMNQHFCNVNMPVSYFMLRDPNDDPMRGEKELMDPGWFMREMSQYDGPGPRLPG